MPADSGNRCPISTSPSATETDLRPPGAVPREPGQGVVARVARVSARTTLSDRWRRGQRGWPDSFPLVQFPNAPLLVALGGWLVAALTDGSVNAYARAAFYAGIAAWAWEELAGGANWARRALGAAGLVYVVVKVGAALGQ